MGLRGLLYLLLISSLRLFRLSTRCRLRVALCSIHLFNRLFAVLGLGLGLIPALNRGLILKLHRFGLRLRPVTAANQAVDPTCVRSLVRVVLLLRRANARFV